MGGHATCLWEGAKSLLWPQLLQSSARSTACFLLSRRMSALATSACGACRRDTEQEGGVHVA